MSWKRIATKSNLSDTNGKRRKKTVLIFTWFGFSFFIFSTCVKFWWCVETNYTHKTPILTLSFFFYHHGNCISLPLMLFPDSLLILMAHAQTSSPFDDLEWDVIGWCSAQHSGLMCLKLKAVHHWSFWGWMTAWPVPCPSQWTHWVRDPSQLKLNWWNSLIGGPVCNEPYYRQCHHPSKMKSLESVSFVA